jgi:hypothetical protein
MISSSLWKSGRWRADALLLDGLLTVQSCLCMAASGLRSVSARSTKMPSDFFSSSIVSQSARR